MSWEAVFAGLTLVWLVGSGIFGYWLNSISNTQSETNKNVSQLAKDVKELEIMLPNEYVKKEDINQRLDKIDSVLERIFDKLDEKADK